MIFANPHILNTPALLRLGAVGRKVGSYAEHKDWLLERLTEMLEKSIAANGKDNVCAILVEYLGQEGLQECLTMTPYQIAEATIMLTSPGAALLSDLRERWANVSTAELEAAGSDLPDGFQEEFESMTLAQWLETLVGEYVDID